MALNSPYKPETLETYAKIFLCERRDYRGRPIHPPIESCKAAAWALNAMARSLRILNNEANEKMCLHNPEKEAKAFAEALVGIVKSQQNRIELLESYKSADIVALIEALDNSQSLLVAMLNEHRPEKEIEDQIIANRIALTKGN
jgi:hypothetical protein